MSTAAEDTVPVGLSGRAVVLVAALLTSLMPFSMDMYLPAMPAMAADLGASANLVQWTVTAFLLGTVLGPLVSGPLSDAHGRRSYLIGAAVVSALTCFASAAVSSIEELLVLRVVQSLATGTAFTVARAMLSDIHSGNQLARSLSLTMMIMTVAPLIAPGLGGEIMLLFGWRAIFVTLGVISAATALLCLVVLKETLGDRHRQPFSAAAAAKRFVSILGDRFAFALACISGFLSAAYFASLASVSFVIIDYHGGSSRLFAVFFATAGAMAFLTNLANARLVTRFGTRKMLIGGLFFAFLTALALLIVTLTDAGGVGGVIACVIWLMGLFQTISNNSLAGFLTRFRDRAGAASAVFSSVRFAFGIGGSAAVGALYSGHPWALGAVVFAAISGAAMVGLAVLRRPIASM